MKYQSNHFRRRIESLRFRVETLSSIKKLIALPPAYDITERQWSFLESQLSAAQTRLLLKLKRGARKYLPYVNDPEAARNLNALLGEIELEMSRAFTFFDTYMDVLTQRHTPEIGPMLAGCDVLAWDAINKDHPSLAIVEPPLVHCDRGFGASVLREGVLLPDKTPNPMPLIQIPYSRLKEKQNLTSVLHEAGHEAMVRLGMLSTIPRAFRHSLTKAKAPDPIKDLFALWNSEIGPDFWTFCASGIAQAGTIKEIIALRQDHVFRISWTDPHPSPYIRVLLSFELCRQVWGKGDWDTWERNWIELYPLSQAQTGERKLLKKAVTYLPVISKTLLNTKYRVLNGRAMPDLFDLSSLAPSELYRIAKTAESGTLKLKGLSPCAQLAVFRLIRERGKLKEEEFDKIMTKWLLKLGENKRNLN